MKITKGLVEQHIHGAFGCDFMNCTADDILTVSKMLLKNGVTAFFPTVMTDDLSVIKKRIQIIKKAQSYNIPDGADIAGIHLEGPFINKEKSGIHEKKYILPLDITLFKEIEDEIIKIVTLAPELDINNNFINYIHSKKIKVSAGHFLGSVTDNIDQTAHLYNAMGAFSHRGVSSTVSALANENIYTEIIADSMHISDEVLKITFKIKDLDKVLLISDALPPAHSDKSQMIFAGQKIYNKNGRLVNDEGIFAGSSMLLCDIVKNIVDKKILSFDNAVKTASDNQLRYHNIENKIKTVWDEYNNIINVSVL